MDEPKIDEYKESPEALKVESNLPSTKTKSKTKIVIIFLAIICLVVVILYALSFRDNNNGNSVVETNTNVIAPKSSRAFITRSTASGILDFNEELYELASSESINLTFDEALKSKFTEQGIEDIVFDAGFLSFEGSQLFHLDINKDQVKKLSDEAGSSSIMSNSYILVSKVETNSDGYVYKLVVIDLNSKEEIYIDGGRAYEFVTQAHAVSPDGLKVAIIKEGKINIWDLNTRTVTKSCDLAITPFSENFPRTPDFYKLAPYNSERHYPAPVWMQDNESLIFSDKGYAINYENDPINVESYRNTNILSVNTSTCESKSIPTAEGAKEQLKIHQNKEEAITYFQSNYWNDLYGNFVSNYTPRKDSPKLLDQLHDYQIVDNRMETIIAFNTIGLDVNSYTIDGEYLGSPIFTTERMLNVLSNARAQILEIGFVSDELFMYRIIDSEASKEFIAVYDTKNGTTYDFAEINKTY